MEIDTDKIANNIFNHLISINHKDIKVRLIRDSEYIKNYLFLLDTDIVYEELRITIINKCPYINKNINYKNTITFYIDKNTSAHFIKHRNSNDINIIINKFNNDIHNDTLSISFDFKDFVDSDEDSLFSYYLEFPTFTNEIITLHNFIFYEHIFNSINTILANNISLSIHISDSKNLLQKNTISAILLSLIN